VCAILRQIPILDNTPGYPTITVPQLFLALVSEKVLILLPGRGRLGHNQSDSSVGCLIIKTVNIEDGFPTVEQARTRLRSEIEAAQSRGLKLLKIIHGYGSHGVGGELRVALQSTLRTLASSGAISDCIYGENWRKSDERSWELLKRMPELKSDSDLGRGNRGITIVLL
jgi:Smr domain